MLFLVLDLIIIFQSTLPHGSDVVNACVFADFVGISIHAPSRERRFSPAARPSAYVFQSTLPYGSDT